MEKLLAKMLHSHWPGHVSFAQAWEDAGNVALVADIYYQTLLATLNPLDSSSAVAPIISHSGNIQTSPTLNVDDAAHCIQTNPIPP
jgi:hypothetical protein